jgi:hypothetical protein
MPRSPVEKYVDRFTGQFTELADKILLDIKRRVTAGASIGDIAYIINSTFDKYGIEKEARDAILSGVVKSVASGAGIKAVADPVALKRWYLENAHSADGLSFSTAVNGLVKRGDVVDSVRRAMQIGESWRTAAQRLHDVGIKGGVVAQDVLEVERLARKAAQAANDPEIYAAFRSEMRKTQARINKLVDPSTSKLKRAYQNILDLTEKSSEKAIDRAAKYAVYFKTRYNAERIARTEMARAYGQAFHVENLGDSDSVGYRSQLSSAHSDYDICDFYAQADLYGMGAGVFPKDHGPEYPYHPHCTCILTPIYEGEAEVTRKTIDSKSANKFIDTLSEDKQKSLLGAGGAEAFTKGESSWQDNLKGFKPHAQISATIPKELLFGAPVKAKVVPDVVVGSSRPTPQAIEAAFSHVANPGLKQYLVGTVEKYDDTAAAVVEKHASTFKYENTRSSTSFCRFEKGEIFIGRSARTTNRAGSHLHEFGHAMDKTMGDGKTILSQSDAFNDRLKSDRQKIETNSEVSKKLADIVKDKCNDNYLNDLVFSATWKKLKIGYGHSISYYKKYDKYGFDKMEVFANLFETYSRKDKAAWEIVKEYFPESSSFFENEFKKLI